MTYTSTITSKGQATIPKYIRNILRLKPGHQIAFVEKNGDIVLKAPKSFFDLKGTVSGPDSSNIIAARKQAQAHVAKRHL